MGGLCLRSQQLLATPAGGRGLTASLPNRTEPKSTFQIKLKLCIAHQELQGTDHMHTYFVCAQVHSVFTSNTKSHWNCKKQCNKYKHFNVLNASNLNGVSRYTLNQSLFFQMHSHSQITYLKKKQNCLTFHLGLQSLGLQ